MKKIIFLSLTILITSQTIANNNYVQVVNGEYTSGELLENPINVKFTKVVAGESHGYALDSNGTVWSVGRNSSGELGLGNKTNTNYWTKTSLTGVSDISASGFSGYAIKDGEIYGVGRNNNGELGLGDFQERTEWTATGKTGFKKVEAAIHHAYAIDNLNNVWATGHNTYGQLGLGAESASVNEWSKSNMTDVIDLSTGYYFGVALKSNGEVWSVGRNEEGQLGTGLLNTFEASWTNISDDNPLLTNVTDVGAGWSHSYVVSNGTVYSVGRNIEGSLGLGNNTAYSLYQETSMKNISKVDGGRDHGYALTINGDVWSTGKNIDGQLGKGSTGDSSLWVKTTISNAEDITTDTNFGYILKNNNIWFTGVNGYGLLGNGDIMNKFSWTKADDINL